MLEIVHSIFMVKNLAVSIATYFKLVESVDSKIDKLLSKEYESAVMLLEQARCVTTPQVYVTLLIAAIERFNVAVTLEQRERQLLAYLGLMLCYYYLGETSVICKIQETVSQQAFKSTFWERNGGEIKAAGYVVAGAALALVTGGSAGMGGAWGRRAAQDDLDGAKAVLKEREHTFNELRDAIVAIQFQ